MALYVPFLYILRGAFGTVLTFSCVTAAIHEDCSQRYSFIYVRAKASGVITCGTPKPSSNKQDCEVAQQQFWRIAVPLLSTSPSALSAILRGTWRWVNCVALWLTLGSVDAVYRLLPPPTFNGIKIASTHEKPIVSVKEGQCVVKKRGVGVISAIKVPFRPN